MRVEQLKDILQRKARGQSLDSYLDVNGIIEEAGRCILNDIDFAETKRKAILANAIYSDVYDYALPSDVKGVRITDIYPVNNRYLNNDYRQMYDVDFDKYKDAKTGFNITYRNGTKFIRLSKEGASGADISTADSTTGWSVGDDATGLVLDELNYMSGSGSLRFDLSGAGTNGYLEGSVTSQDLTNYENKGAFFLWVYLPDASAITSVDLRWGSDNTNYWYKSVSTGHFEALQDGWNLLRFDWASATKTLLPDVTAIDYVRINIVYDGTADTDFRIDNLICRLGNQWEVAYYSKYLFRTTAGVWGESITLDSDEINLDSEGINLLIYKCKEIMAGQLSGEDATFDYQTALKEYEEEKERYLQFNKSEVKRKQSFYY